MRSERTDGGRAAGPARRGRGRGGPGALALLAAAAVIFAARATEACSCGSSPPPAEALASADAVFQGRVTAVRPAWSEDHPRLAGALARVLPGRFEERLVGGGLLATVEVQAAWKGVTSTRTQVISQTYSCGFRLIPGETYLLYADDFGDGYEVSACGRSRPIARAAWDLVELGPGSIALREPPSPWAAVWFGATAPLLGGAAWLAWAAARRARRRYGNSVAA